MLDTPRFPRTEVSALPETAVPVFPEMGVTFELPAAHFFQRKTPTMITPTMIRIVLKLNFDFPDEPEEPEEMVCVEPEDPEEPEESEESIPPPKRPDRMLWPPDEPEEPEELEELDEPEPPPRRPPIRLPARFPLFDE